MVRVMALTEREERILRDIACSLRRDDRALARRLGVSTRPDLTAEWLIIAPIAPGLLTAAAGDHWRITVCAVVGVLIAVAGPPAVSIWLSRRP
jgi:Protein of unknown function (DUF3040)